MQEATKEVIGRHVLLTARFLVAVFRVGERLTFFNKPSRGEIVRRGSLLFRIRSDRDVWTLYVWEGWFGRKHWRRLKHFKSYDKAMNYIAEYI